MADEENEEGEEGEESGSNKKEEKVGSSNKLLIVILVFLVLMLVGMGIGGYLMLDKINSVQGGSETEKVEVKEEEEEEEDTNPDEIGHIIDFDQVIVNLNSTKGSKNYLKLKINLELRSEESVELYEKRKALIFDILLTTVSNKTKEELMSIGGKEELKEELKTSFNDMLGKKIIRNIYWRMFVIQ